MVNDQGRTDARTGRELQGTCKGPPLVCEMHVEYLRAAKITLQSILGI